MISFRKTVPEDLPTIADWIAQDKGHAGMEPTFFTTPAEGASCYTIEDEQGPCIFVRQEVAGTSTRLHTQFPISRKRVAKALREAYPLVANDAKERGYRTIKFESKSLALIRFMFQNFDFRADLIADL